MTLERSSQKTSSRPGQSGGYQFGTFKGVFLPSIVTILGVVMFLRSGWVLGHVGYTQFHIIISLATAITLLTAFSISALATNMRIGERLADRCVVEPVRSEH